MAGVLDKGTRTCYRPRKYPMQDTDKDSETHTTLAPPTPSITEDLTTEASTLKWRKRRAELARLREISAEQDAERARLAERAARNKAHFATRISEIRRLDEARRQQKQFEQIENTTTTLADHLTEQEEGLHNLATAAGRLDINHDEDAEVGELPGEDTDIAAHLDAPHQGPTQATATPPRVVNAARKAIVSAFDFEKLTAIDTLPYRIRCCYRVVRAIADAQGLLSTGETLMDLSLDGIDDSPACDIDPWTDAPEPEHIPEKARYGKGNFWMTQTVSSRLFKQPIPLLPPAAPIDPTTRMTPPPPHYEPHRDERLLHWLDIFNRLVDAMNVRAGTKLDPEFGLKGLEGVGTPELTRLLFPTRMQIIAWEQVLIEQTLHAVVHSGSAGAKRLLRDRYGMSVREVKGLMRLASDEAVRQTQSDIDQDRAIMKLRLEDVIRRARSSLDIRAELAGLKNLAIMQGLAHVENNSALSEMINIVQDVHIERQQNLTIEGGSRVPESLKWIEGDTIPRLPGVQ